ncbi:hypothetical protein D3C81_384430 [compost metagenome]
MEKVFVNIVTTHFESTQEEIDELYNEIKDSSENQWCRYVGDDMLVGEGDNMEMELNFKIYAWTIENGNPKRFNISEEVIDQMIEKGGEGSYSLLTHNNVSYDIMWNCVEF